MSKHAAAPWLSQLKKAATLATDLRVLLEEIEESVSDKCQETDETPEALDEFHGEIEDAAADANNVESWIDAVVEAIENEASK